MGSSLLLKGGTNTPRSIVESFSLANAFSPGDAIRYDIPSSTWVKAQADSAENSEVAGIVSAASFNTFDLTYSGYIQVSALSGVSAPVLFLDSTIAGGLTTSPPSAIGTVIKPVLTKTTNGSGYIVTNYLGTQIGGSSTVAIDEIQPVGTVVPFAGSTIPDSWLECNGASYAVSAYPNLYAKLQYSSGDRAPAYGYVANITVGNSTAYAVGQVVSQAATGLSGTVLAHTALGSSNTNTLTVQVIPTYSSTTKNFVQPNAVFSNAAVTIGTIASAISAVSTTHFNTPDLRGRFAIGENTSRLPTINDLESDTANNSAISAIYSLGSEGGQESTIAGTGVATGTSAYVTSAAASGGLVANIPPYTVVRYIIKASPYTRAAIIDGIDIPYTSLLVSDLRDGSLRPNGSGEDLVFKTNDGSSGVERMRLTNTPTNAAPGSLVVGESSLMSGYDTAYRLLVVAKTTDGGGGVVVTRSASVSLESGVDEGSGSGIIGTRTTHPLIFRTNTTERMRVDANGQANIRSTVNSTSTTTGGLTLGGGLGMASNLTVGGGISAAGGITFSNLTRVTNNTPSTSTATGALTVAGGVGVAGALYVGAIQTQTLNAASNATSNSTATGALTVVGGVGIAGALNVGGGISAGGSLDVVGGISASGTLTVGGGITAATLNCSGQVKSGSISTGTFTATSLAASADTQSTATNIGALTVVGGAGIGKNLFVGGGITATGSLDLGSGAIRTSGSLNCGNIAADGTFQAKSLNASANTTSTSTGSGSLVVAGGAGIAGALNVGGGISAGGVITSAGNLNLGTPRNYTSTSAYGNMIRAIGFHSNTKIQLVASGEGSGTFIGNGTTAGSALLMWAGEPNATFYGSGIGANLNASPGTEAETRQFTGQAQAFIRFNNPEGSIGFHTSAVGATASLTSKVAILSTGGLDVASGIVSTSSASGALVVTGAGGAGIGGALNVGGAASFAGNVGIGGNASSDARLTINAHTSGYSGGIIHSNTQSGSYLRIVPLGTNSGVGGWANSSVVFEGIPALNSSGNTIIGSVYQDLVFQTGQRTDRMRINYGGALIHNGTTSGAVGAISFVPSSVNPIYNRIVFGGDDTGYGLAIASQNKNTGVVTDRLVIYDADHLGIKIPKTTASTSTTTGALTVAGGLGVAGALNTGATATFAGKVGIGTIAPGSPLHVVGTQNYGSGANSGIVTIGNANNSRQINLGVSDTNSVVYIEGWVPGVGGSHLVLQPSGGRVGIGKSAPTQALDVSGSIVASGAVNSNTQNVTGLSTLTRLSVHDGTSDVNGNYTISSVAPPGTVVSGAILGYSNNRQIYALLGFNNAYSFYGEGAIFNNGALTNTGTLTNNGAITATGNITTAGALNAGTQNVSGLSTLTRLSVFNGSSDINGACRISARASAADTAALIGYSNNQAVYAILGYQNTYSFDGVGTFRHNGSLNNTGTLTNTGAITATGNISAVGNLNVGDPRNYTASSALHSSSYMMRALGSHHNTKIQLVSTGNSDAFGGNSDLAGASLLMWASEPSLTYSGSGIGSNMTCSPLATDNRQFTGQGQAFIRFTGDGSMGFHTAPVGTLILPTTPRVSISPAGALNAGTLNVSGLSKLHRLSVYDGASDLNSNYTISAQAQGGNGAVLGYTNNQACYGILGHANAYSFYGLGTIANNGAITATTTITPGAWDNGSAPRSYISTAAPPANFTGYVNGSIWFVV